MLHRDRAITRGQRNLEHAERCFEFPANFFWRRNVLEQAVQTGKTSSDVWGEIGDPTLVVYIPSSGNADDAFGYLIRAARGLDISGVAFPRIVVCKSLTASRL